jgi:hypothetical protein
MLQQGVRPSSIRREAATASASWRFCRRGLSDRFPGQHAGLAVQVPELQGVVSGGQSRSCQLRPQT